MMSWETNNESKCPSMDDIQKCFDFYKENKENIVEYLGYIAEYLVQDEPYKVPELVKMISNISASVVNKLQHNYSDLDLLFRQVQSHSRITNGKSHWFFAALHKWSYVCRGQYKKVEGNDKYYAELRNLYDEIVKRCSDADLSKFAVVPYANNRYVVPFIKNILEQHRKG